MKKNPRAFDVLGNVAIVRLKDKKRFAQSLIKKQKPIKTVLEKKGKIKGRLRKIQTQHLAGEKTKEVFWRRVLDENEEPTNLYGIYSCAHAEEVIPN